MYVKSHLVISMQNGNGSKAELRKVIYMSWIQIAGPNVQNLNSVDNFGLKKKKSVYVFSAEMSGMRISIVRSEERTFTISRDFLHCSNYFSLYMRRENMKVFSSEQTIEFSIPNS